MPIFGQTVLLGGDEELHDEQDAESERRGDADRNAVSRSHGVLLVYTSLYKVYTSRLKASQGHVLANEITDPAFNEDGESICPPERPSLFEREPVCRSYPAPRALTGASWQVERLCEVSV